MGKLESIPDTDHGRGGKNAVVSRITALCHTLITTRRARVTRDA
jgi:hypothetical protein